MTKEKILIVIKTYPVMSESYTEVACTAGVREDGSWVRLFPIPFRLLERDKRYAKYQWVEAEVEYSKDIRPESRRVPDVYGDGIVLLDKVDTGKNRDWAQRRQLLLDKNKIYTNKKEIITKAHANELSLVIFKPSKITDFVIKKANTELSADKLQAIQDRLKRENILDEHDLVDFEHVRKLPYKFSYSFLDDEGIKSTLMIEDWEIGALYWNCLKRHGEEIVLKKVREQYMDNFVGTKDLYLFLGTTRQWHIRKAPNPYVIIGTFYPPYEK
ncbi:MAG: hypothetical protein FWE93_03615 [Alphaproteobacteria bacterium]|nr:hypothetical protein [Alphaproteobacteria bacterium]